MKYLLGLLLVVTFCTVTVGEKRGHSEIEPCGYNIQFTPDMIPLVIEPLPVFELGAAIVAPQGFVSDIVKNIDPSIELKTVGDDGISVAYVNNTLIAFVDKNTGVSKVFPLFQPLAPGEGLNDKAKVIGDSLASNRSLFPIQDFEQVIALGPTTLSRSQSAGKGNATSPEDILAYVRLQRQVNGYPVFGPETRAMIAVAADDSIRALSHRWRPASPSNESVVPYSRQEIADSILHQLSMAIRINENITVDRVNVSYYEGAKFLQPVYRFEATIISTSLANNHLVGYVSIGEPTEPLPTLEDVLSTNLSLPIRRDIQEIQLAPRQTIDVTVGLYVDRNSDAGWLDSAILFWTYLNFPVLVFPFFATGLTFVDSQFLPANQPQYVSERNSYVNTVQIALTEGHGNWGRFTTYDTDPNPPNVVYLSDVGAAGGYGTNAGGSLVYWILHGCEIIPTQTDEPTSFDVWWGIFRGMRSAIGYRTEMLIADGATADLGLSVALNVPVVSAWFSSIAENPNYGQNDATYFDTNRQIFEPYGRASSVSDCGHVDDTATDLGNIPNPTYLCEHWFAN